MEGKNLARIGAIVFVAFAITATVIELTREDEPVRQAAAPAPALAPTVDPLRAEQRRCQQMGEAAASDRECLRVWAETRDRFIGRSPSDSAQRGNEDQ